MFKFNPIYRFFKKILNHLFLKHALINCGPQMNLVCKVSVSAQRNRQCLKTWQVLSMIWSFHSDIIPWNLRGQSAVSMWSSGPSVSNIDVMNSVFKSFWLPNGIPHREKSVERESTMSCLSRDHMGHTIHRVGCWFIQYSSLKVKSIYR
jgi:hypothetical protein